MSVNNNNAAGQAGMLWGYSVRNCRRRRRISHSSISPRGARWATRSPC